MYIIDFRIQGDDRISLFASGMTLGIDSENFLAVNIGSPILILCSDNKIAACNTFLEYVDISSLLLVSSKKHNHCWKPSIRTAWLCSIAHQVVCHELVKTR